MEKIAMAAIKLSDGTICVGKRHCDCFKVASDMGKDGFNETQGFITNIDNRFVGRREARQIAEKAGQLIARASKGNILYSEDIY